MKIIPLKTRRSSTLGLPWLFGKNGRSRAICSSLSQKGLLIMPPSVWERVLCPLKTGPFEAGVFG